MPEGDTLHRVALQITTQLCGRRAEDARARAGLTRAAQLAGRRLETAEARGKHLLLDFESGLCVHSHLGMTGSWHIYPRGERWRKPARRAALALRFDSHDLVCFSPMLIEVDATLRVRRDAFVAGLGPDLLAGAFDEAGAVARLRARGEIAVGEALMNQRLVAGIGNVYKSEILFMNRLNPFHPVSGYDDDALRNCLRSARHHMRRNLEGPKRRFRGTTLGDRLWVYRRRGLPCLACATPIEMRRQGDAARSTYFCPTCQAVGR